MTQMSMAFHKKETKMGKIDLKKRQGGAARRQSGFSSLPP
jgi:hypothetical protein